MTKVRATMAGSGPFARALYVVGRSLVVFFCYAWNRTTVDGREHIPSTGPFVLAPIHRSNLDTPYAATTTRRRLRYMGKDSLWNHAWIAWLLSALGGFPVTRGAVDREALERCIEVLQRGEPLVVFPEGARQSGPLVQPLYEGAGYLSVKTGAPIVPVGIGGSERVQRKGSKMIWPSKVHVIIGAPMYPPTGLQGKAKREASKQLTDDLHAELQRLFDLAQLRAGV